MVIQLVERDDRSFRKMTRDDFQAFFGRLVQVEIEIRQRNDGFRILFEVGAHPDGRGAFDQLVFPYMRDRGFLLVKIHHAR